MRLVAHHEDFKFLDIVNQELPESSGQHVFCFLVTTITNVGHQHLTLEASAHSVVNTSGLPPVFLDLDIAVGLMSDKLLGPFLEDFRLGEGSELNHDESNTKAIVGPASTEDSPE